MKKTVWMLAFLLVTGVVCSSVHAMASATTVTTTPEPVTLGGIIHADSDDTLAFTPDGKTVFFDRSSGSHKTIMVSHKVNGRWSKPQVASFSGRWFDQDPVVAPDGSYLLFDSNRPVTPGGEPLRQDYFNGGPGPGSNIWRVDRKGNGWGKPEWLGPVINSDVFVDFASIAADDTLYFMLWDKKADVMHIWRSQYRDGEYLPPERAGLGDPDVSTHDPAVAPDQSFIVFDYGKVKGGLGRLSIAFREGDHWSKPIDLGDVVNEDIPWGSHIAPDGHTVYFTGHSGISRLSLEPWLDAHQAAATAARPQIFAPGVISGPANDDAATFSPDGSTVYFFRSNHQDYDIMVSHRIAGHWSQPKIASFSGHWRDLEPAMAPDGSYLIFASSRPIDGGDEPPTGHWGGQAHPGRGGNLWRVNREGDGWSKPVRLPDTVNRLDSTFSPSIARDGTLYFMAATNGGHFRLYRSEFKDGAYQPAKLLPFSAGKFGGTDETVAPDQSFIIFSSNRPPSPPHSADLFIAFHDNGSWGKPIDLGSGINEFSPTESRLGPDGHTLYLSGSHVIPPVYPKTLESSKTGLQRMQSWNNGNDNIWTIDLAPWLRAHREEN